MSAHTPGPWRLKDHDSNLVIAGSEFYHTEIVATCSYAPDERAATANAHLIAAAPDLLAYAFLEKRLEEFDCPHDAEHRCRCGNAHDEMIAEARNLRERAIAKAEGR